MDMGQNGRIEKKRVRERVWGGRQEWIWVK
jgi:hypothetical protein